MSRDSCFRTSDTLGLLDEIEELVAQYALEHPLEVGRELRLEVCFKLQENTARRTSWSFDDVTPPDVVARLREGP